MPVPLLAMALGGAALGALANPEDRKKGALMGLGAGLLAPLAGGALAGGGTAAGGTAAGGTAAGGAVGAGTAAAAPTALAGASNAGANMAMLGGGTFAPVGAQAGLAAPGATSVVTGGVPQAIQSTLGEKIGLAAANAYDAGKAGLKKAAEATGDYIKEEGPGMAKDLGMQGAVMAMQPQPQQQAPAGRSMALRGQQQDGVSLYDQAAMKTQARMKQRTAPKRYI